MPVATFRLTNGGTKTLTFEEFTQTEWLFCAPGPFEAKFPGDSEVTQVGHGGFQREFVESISADPEFWSLVKRHFFIRLPGCDDLVEAANARAEAAGFSCKYE